MATSTQKFVDSDGAQRMFEKVKSVTDTKADSSHTHDRVNGYKIVVSTTVPTTNDSTIITFVK